MLSKAFRFQRWRRATASPAATWSQGSMPEAQPREA